MAFLGLDPNLMAASVTGAGTVLAAWVAVAVKRRMGKVDAAAAGLAAQLGGWDRYTGHLQSGIEALQAREAECQRRLTAIEGENEDLRAEAAALHERIVVLEQRVLPS